MNSGAFARSFHVHLRIHVLNLPSSSTFLIRYDGRIATMQDSAARLRSKPVTKTTILPSAVTSPLHSVGVAPGSVVLMHPDAIVAARFAEMPNEERLDLLPDSIKTAVGGDGTLVISTFSYSFTIRILLRAN